MTLDDPLIHLTESTRDAPRAAEPGRACPLHYQYGPQVFARNAPSDLSDLEVLYVVGGLYGNELALHEVLRLFEREQGCKRLVFNGDFHWFDAAPDTFARIQREVLAHTCLRGNVETELSDDTSSDAAGCGCAYPEWVSDGVVTRSNHILQRLRGATTPAQRSELSALPMWLRADVGDMRLGLVHGDAQSLAGWGFAQEHMREPGHRDRARGWFRAADVDAFACTHTCLPVFQALNTSGLPGRHWILNNGAAGMPNFRDDGAGLLTRVALRPLAGRERRFGVRQGNVFMDAIALQVDIAEVRRRFLHQWPEASDANISYYQRIVQGPEYTLDEAIRLED
ncbi:metallophosphoesterase family protein [Cupriavidus sp. CP313]